MSVSKIFGYSLLTCLKHQTLVAVQFLNTRWEGKLPLSTETKLKVYFKTKVIDHEKLISNSNSSIPSWWEGN